MDFNQKFRSVIKEYIRKEYHGKDDKFAEAFLMKYGAIKGLSKSSIKDLIAGRRNFSTVQVKYLSEFIDASEFYKYYFEDIEKSPTSQDIKTEVGEDTNYRSISCKETKLTPVDLYKLLCSYADSEFPLLVLCDQCAYIEYLLQKQGIVYHNAGESLTDDDVLNQPYECVYSHISTLPLSKDVSKLFNDALLQKKKAKELGIHRYIIVAVETRNHNDIKEALKVYGVHHNVIAFSMDEKFWKYWCDDVKVHPELRSFIRDTLKKNEPKPTFYIPNWEKTFTTAQQIASMLDGMSNSREDILRKLYGTDEWREMFAFYVYLLDKEFPKGGTERTDFFSQMEAEAEERSNHIADDLKARYSRGYKILESFPKRPVGFNKCDKQAYLYALQEMRKVISNSIVWNEDYKRELKCWLKYGNIKGISYMNREAWVQHLSKQHAIHAIFLDAIKNEPLLKEVWISFCKNGFPSTWFDSSCSHLSVLRLLVEYRKFNSLISNKICSELNEKKKNDYERSMQGVSKDVGMIRWFGTKTNKTTDEWHEWLEERFMYHSVTYDFDFDIRKKK